MSKIRIALLAIALAALVVVVAGCGSDDDSTSASGDSTSAATVSLSDCTPDTLETKTAGTLTVGTDKPAYPPYFEDDDPTNGKGFESAVAYAIADQLGFDADRGRSGRSCRSTPPTRPGPKDFDFDVNQISITPKRAEQVDFSAPVLRRPTRRSSRSRTPTPPSATSLADLQDAKIGVQIGTTSLDAVNDVDPADQRAAGVRQLQRRRHARSRRARSTRSSSTSRPRFYLTAAQVPDGDDRRPVPGPRRRPVGRAAGEGLAADRLRLRGDRRAAELRRAAARSSSSGSAATGAPRLQ